MNFKECSKAHCLTYLCQKKKNALIIKQSEKVELEL